MNSRLDILNEIFLSMIDEYQLAQNEQFYQMAMMSASIANANTHSMNRGKIIEKPSSHRHNSHIFKLKFFLTNSSKYFHLTHLHRSNNSTENKKPKQIENLYSKQK